MNLAQIRSAVRDILTAGLGQNTAFTEDAFWSSNEINYAINQAQNFLYKVIRKARADYFTRILRSTDSPLTIDGRTFDPTTLAWVSGTGNYTLPPDFMRMKLITDLSGDNARISASDIAKNEFRVLMNQTAGQATREYWYDILGVRTIAVRPIPAISKDLEYIYEKRLPVLRDWTAGSVSATKGSAVVAFTGTADIQNRLIVGDELIIGNAVTADPNAVYPVIKSIDSSTQATLDGPFLDATVASVAYQASSVSEIPSPHHHLLTCYAAFLLFGKGPNLHTDSASFWQGQFNKELPHLIDDVELRQGSDGETVQAYLEDYYDL